MSIGSACLPPPALPERDCYCAVQTVLLRAAKLKAVAVVEVIVHVISLSYALQYSSTDGSGMRSCFLVKKEGGALISAARASL